MTEPAPATPERTRKVAVSRNWAKLNDAATRGDWRDTEQQLVTHGDVPVSPATRSGALIDAASTQQTEPNVNDAAPISARATAPKLHPLLIAAALAVIGASALAAVMVVSERVSVRHLAGTEQAVVTAAAAAAAHAPEPAAHTPPATAAPVPKARTASARHTARNTAPTPAPQIADKSASEPAAIQHAPIQPASIEPALATGPVAPPACSECGTVVAIREVRSPGRTNGIGAVAGGVVGGVIGNQIGSGSGRDVARILGAIGGAVAGHQVEKRARATVRYDVDVRMDDGQVRTVTRSTPPELRSGDAVRLQGDALLLRDGRPVAERRVATPEDRGGA